MFELTGLKRSVPEVIFYLLILFIFFFLSPIIFTGNHELDNSILVRINVKILGDFSAVS